MRKAITAIVIIAAAVTGYVISYPVFNNGEKLGGGKQIAGEQDPKQTQNGPFVAVIYDNDPNARPQFGLSEASIVFETVAEGGITRMLAFFDKHQKITKIGPVRSARPYFVDWARGFGSALAHSGGSREALAQISSLGNAFHDINEFFNEHTFRRDTRRTAPHNLFTSSDLLQSFASGKAWPLEMQISPWAVSDEKAGENVQTTATSIRVDFSYPQFVASYQYDVTNKNYIRSLGGRPDKDAINGQQITAKNVVILYTTSSVIDPKLLTVDLITSGSGRAMVFTNGKVMQARWQKSGSAGELKIVDADGSSVVIGHGPTWIEVIDQNAAASWK
ncbi:MAG: hypothetical protein A3C85_02200 [Candidatus Doudnabacteria bacterium RIFCSPHIGHO2_02_FULL_48_21]|uniref:DUF3048 domain-containing protein n=1 Tax=Candidatus Doudnabacteria bacterium RIFCSPLOWO2_02_FULL_48_13 TaxID=1817845 RepID=A0A1F5QA05_9BACT|nr:MAG: hypothetical protein A3K05_02490 [Candidatus Doudnabacteria bacterium RIFCSPHIGHO2_01_48_18]OGE78447.1 MAG: hypothetical protein A2668_04495 [Candidatus Doudnabacteria bacterium RIFCSPHIGHO2_01_FULL_48_180]OGE91701.1 MAG: hypothetical protein A3F44_01525 [Candidatus Doudnabacteria bacterium RIFCSPHIGHO2_12_FULL_47_25]OGE93438.1 MAG: hypothetical protein A3C85_02200 [Candidatus Doudnabacteria bacterium RIFCSPHIGHO2_02_FULL_48_21]OGE99003.1 MAG: hypothetical protein A3J05_04070 [Candidatu